MLNRTIQLFIVVASSVLSLISTDILLPSLPQIAHSFGVADNEAKMIISTFMLGQFCTVLIWGIIADLLGRRTALFLGMLVFLVGSLLSLQANSINLLLTCRFLQGTGAVVVPVAGWALIQDLFPKDEGARIMSWIGTLVAILPLLAPAIGGKIDVAYGWQANLYGIAGYSAVLCLLMFLLPQQKKHQPLVAVPSLKKRFLVYGQILKNRTFISYITLFGLLTGGEWCFLTMAPFYYTSIHVPPDTLGLLLMIVSIGFLLGSLIASKLFKQIGVDKVILLGIRIAIASSFMLLIGDYLHWSNYPLFGAVLMSLYLVGSALLWGSCTSRALQCFDEVRGSASAVRSLILLCFTALGTYSGRILNHNSLQHTSIFLLIMASCALVIFNNKEFKAERLAADTAC